jgi:hypothetical protein
MPILLSSVRGVGVRLGIWYFDIHIHLVLQMGHQHISQAMQHLAFRYSRYINRKEKRIGHLFQVRFKAILTD